MMPFDWIRPEVTPTTSWDFGVIRSVDMASYTVVVDGLGGLGRNIVCEWLGGYCHPGDTAIESRWGGIVPEENARVLVLYQWVGAAINGKRKVIRCLAIPGAPPPSGVNGYRAFRGRQVELQPGDWWWDTRAGNFAWISSSGEVWLQANDNCFQYFFPSDRRIFQRCFNYQQYTAGGLITWEEDYKRRTSYEQVWYNKRDGNTKEIVGEAIQRLEIGFQGDGFRQQFFREVGSKNRKYIHPRQGPKLDALFTDFRDHTLENYAYYEQRNQLAKQAVFRAESGALVGGTRWQYFPVSGTAKSCVKYLNPFTQENFKTVDPVLTGVFFHGFGDLTTEPFDVKEAEALDVAQLLAKLEDGRLLPHNLIQLEYRNSDGSTALARFETGMQLVTPNQVWPETRSTAITLQIHNQTGAVKSSRITHSMENGLDGTVKNDLGDISDFCHSMCFDLGVTTWPGNGTIKHDAEGLRNDFYYENRHRNQADPHFRWQHGGSVQVGRDPEVVTDLGGWTLQTFNHLPSHANQRYIHPAVGRDDTCDHTNSWAFASRTNDFYYEQRNLLGDKPIQRAEYGESCAASQRGTEVKGGWRYQRFPGGGSKVFEFMNPTEAETDTDAVITAMIDRDSNIFLELRDPTGAYPLIRLDIGFRIQGIQFQMFSPAAPTDYAYQDTAKNSNAVISVGLDYTKGDVLWDIKGSLMLNILGSFVFVCVLNFVCQAQGIFMRALEKFYRVSGDEMVDASVNADIFHRKSDYAPMPYDDITYSKAGPDGGSQTGRIADVS